MSNDSQMLSVLRRAWEDLPNEERVSFDLIKEILDIEVQYREEPTKAQQAVAIKITEYLQKEAGNAKS